jgi:hypothetical protein
VRARFGGVGSEMVAEKGGRGLRPRTKRDRHLETPTGREDSLEISKRWETRGGCCGGEINKETPPERAPGGIKPIEESVVEAMATHKHAVLHLYRRCLRTAARSPATEQAATWITYTKIKFREGRRALQSERDRANGMADALEQCERMEYYQRAAGLLVPQARSSPTLSTTATSTTSSNPTATSTSDGLSTRTSALQEWLESNLRIPGPDAEVYAKELVERGFDDTQSLAEDATEDDFREVGMKTGHLRRIMKWRSSSADGCLV